MGNSTGKPNFGCPPSLRGKSCQKLVDIGATSVGIGPKLAGSEPNRAKIGRVGRPSAECWSVLGKCGRLRPKLVSNSCRNRVCGLRPILADVGRNSSNLTHSGQHLLGQIGPNSIYAGWARTSFDRTKPEIGKIWPRFGRN